MLYYGNLLCYCHNINLMGGDETATALELIRENKTEELWQKCCGFIDLNIEQFMSIQYQLLLEQIELLNKCELGERVMRGARPHSVEEFRRQVPLTTYSDYAPFLPERMEEALPEKPMLWQRTSGRSGAGEFSCKWVPITARTYRELGDAFMALLLFASGKEKGDVVYGEHDKFLYALAPPPYASGCWAHRLDEEGVFDFLPPVEEAESMDFQKRIEEGFRIGLSEGIDMMAAIAGVLVAVGERFGQGGSMSRIISMLNKPGLLLRLLKAVLKSKLARRSLLPRDVWSLKGLVSSGTDSNIYREKIKEMWGRYPLDIYGATESVIISMQTWDYADMTFVPNLNFLEFIPEADYSKWYQDRNYRPLILMLDEVMPGNRYVVIITSFLGGAFVRYVLDDIITITSLRNEKLNINIPQMSFYGRASDIIDFAAFTHAFLTEKMVWQAVANSGCDYVDWVARKEAQKDTPVLCVYIELKADDSHKEEELTTLIHEQLKLLNQDYRELEDFFGFKPLKVILLHEGAFTNYRTVMQASGADLAHLKPPHMNPPDKVVEILTGEKVPSVPTPSDGAVIETPARPDSSPPD